MVNDFVGGNTTVSWQNVSNTCGAFVGYKIYASNTRTGPYNLLTTIATQSQTSYIHIGAAVGTWYYYMESDFNCPGATILQSDTIQNEANPTTPLIKNVDVNPDGTVTFNWYPSISPQTRYYIIYSVLPNGTLFPIDTVFGRNTQTYTDLFQTANTQSLSYTIAAADSCVGNQPSAYNTDPHSTVLLTSAVSPCEKNIVLDWSEYEGYTNGVIQYQVLASINQSPYTTVGTTDSTITTFNFDAFNDGDSVCLTIVAVNATDTFIKSHSNYVCLRAKIVQPPKFVYLTNLTVTNANQIAATWIVDTLGEILKYDIDNSPTCSNYVLVDDKNVAPPLLQFEQFLDQTTSPQESAFCYQIIAYDSCVNSITSPSGKTIFLEAELTDYYEVSLNWNAFEMYGATVTKYNIYRDFGTGYQLIKTVSSNVFTYQDSLYNYLNQKGNFCYKIEAEYTISLPQANYSATLLSTSNVVCIEHRPIIYIPNAFVPNGVNNIFKPTIFFGDPSNYSMTIWNRYGAKIFESKDPTIGWNGTDKSGSLQSQGGYGYLIKFIAADGVDIERKGMVLLIAK